MHYPLLVSLFNEVILIDCTLTDDKITIGALYIHSFLRDKLLRFNSLDRAEIDIELPETYLNHPSQAVAYGVTLSVVRHTPAQT